VFNDFCFSHRFSSRKWLEEAGIVDASNINQTTTTTVLSNKECYGMEERNRWEISVGLVVTMKIN
jgi:hypothetical protein